MARFLGQVGVLATAGVVLVRAATAAFPDATAAVLSVGGTVFLVAAGLKWLWERQFSGQLMPVSAAVVLLGVLWLLGGLVSGAALSNLFGLILGLFALSLLVQGAGHVDQLLWRAGWPACVAVGGGAFALLAGGRVAEWAVGPGPLAVVVLGTVAVNAGAALVLAATYADYVLANPARPLAAIAAAGDRWRRQFVGRTAPAASPVVRGAAAVALTAAGLWAACGSVEGAPLARWVGVGTALGLAAFAGGAAGTARACWRALVVWLQYNADARTDATAYHPAGWRRRAVVRQAAFAAVVAVNVFGVRAVCRADDAAAGTKLQSVQAHGLGHSWPDALDLFGGAASLLLPLALPFAALAAVAGPPLRAIHHAVEEPLPTP